MKNLLFILVFIFSTSSLFAEQYVVQFLENGSLVKSYKVTKECPIRIDIPKGRTQIIFEEKDIQKFEAIEVKYNQDGLLAIFDLLDGSYYYTKDQA